MPIGDIFQQTVVSLKQAEPMANVFYLRVIDDAGTTDPEEDAAMALFNQVIFNMKTVQSVDVEYECILSRRVRPTTRPARVIQVTGAGIIGGDSLPANVCISFRHYSGNGDKNKRGRYFVGGIAETFVKEGRLDGGNDALFAGFIGRYTSDIVDVGRTYRVQHYSKKLDTFYDIDSGTTNPVTTKIRNRTPGICSIT